MQVDKDFLSLEKIRQKETPERSLRWYQDQIRSLGLGQVDASDVMRSDIGWMTGGKPTPGDMVLFLYDPKTKDSLPYYDTAPLVIPFRSAKGGWYGMNLHYLPPLLRMQLLGRLMEFSTTKPNLTETTRLRLRWSLLNNAAKFPGIKFCIKRYLYSHVQSRIMVINPIDWKKAVSLPIENFVKASKNKVYADARKAL